MRFAINEVVTSVATRVMREYLLMNAHLRWFAP